MNFSFFYFSNSCFVFSLSMGQNISKPLQGENPVDFMVRNNKVYWRQPFGDHLAGWSKSVGPQIEKYPRFGSFKDNDMELMKSMVKGGWGDPQRDNKYMGESYEMCSKMKTIWNQGTEHINKVSKISNDAPSTVKTPPPYDTATVQNNAQTSSNLYPSLHSFVSCAHPLPPLEMNKETVRMGAAQLSMAWVQEGPRIIL